MAAMKREDWIKLSPKEKAIYRIKRVIDRSDALQRGYDRDRASGKITKSISFLEQ